MDILENDFQLFLSEPLSSLLQEDIAQCGLYILYSHQLAKNG